LYTNYLESTIHNNQKLEKTQCPPTDGWINKMMDGKTKLNYSTLKRNEISIHQKHE